MHCTNKSVRFYTKMNTKKIIVFGILGLLIFIGIATAISSATSSKQTPSNTPTPESTATPQATETPTPTPIPLTLEEKMKQVVTSKISNATIEIVDAVDNKTFDKIPGKKDVLIDYEMNGTFWDTKGARVASYKNATDLMQAVFPIDPIVASILVTAKVPTKDTYGKSNISVLTAITLSRETYNKINFTDFDYHNIPTIADIYSERNIK